MEAEQHQEMLLCQLETQRNLGQCGSLESSEPSGRLMVLLREQVGQIRMGGASGTLLWSV